MKFLISNLKGNETQFCYFDDEDVFKLFNYRWHLAERSKRCTYAAAYCNNKKSKVYMHQLILKAPSGFCIDHINGNGLDNRKQNLRIATQSQNLANKPFFKGKFKGVSFSKRNKILSKPWAVKVGRKHIGYFSTEEEAAMAYDKSAIEMYGEFAWLNFPINNYNKTKEEVEE